MKSIRYKQLAKCYNIKRSEVKFIYLEEYKKQPNNEIARISFTEFILINKSRIQLSDIDELAKSMSQLGQALVSSSSSAHSLVEALDAWSKPVVDHHIEFVRNIK